MSRPAPNPTTLVRTLLCLVASAAIAVGLQARERAAGMADLYAYRLADSTGKGDACGFDYIDLDLAGHAVPLARARKDVAADDAAAVIALAEPFELYQSPARSLVVSANGYLAPAGSLEEEDGSDYSNDCGLPARADNATARQDRIYVYHDDLRPQADGRVRQAYFARCPRASDAGGGDACTVVEWDGFERAGPIPSSRPLKAQAVLYHGSQEVVMQYASVDDSRGAQATIGLQGFDGRVARQASCDAAGRVAPRKAICFFDPRHPESPARVQRR